MTNCKTEKFGSALFFLVIVAILGGLLVSCHLRTQRIMDIEYCWDEQGQHYLAPDAACTHYVTKPTE